MRIPPRVNTVWDWWSRTVWQPYVATPGPRVATVMAAGALFALPFLPELAAALALVMSGVLIGWAMRAPRVDALQHKLDEADVKIGSLSETTRKLMRGQAVDCALETRVLPRIEGNT